MQNFLQYTFKNTWGSFSEISQGIAPEISSGFSPRFFFSGIFLEYLLEIASEESPIMGKILLKKKNSVPKIPEEIPRCIARISKIQKYLEQEMKSFWNGTLGRKMNPMEILENLKKMWNNWNCFQKIILRINYKIFSFLEKPFWKVLSEVHRTISKGNLQIFLLNLIEVLLVG